MLHIIGDMLLRHAARNAIRAHVMSIPRTHRHDAAHAHRLASARFTRWLVATAVVVLVVGLGVVLLQASRPRQSDRDWQASVARGRRDFATGSCISCHALYPISTAGGAIDLTHEGSRRTLAWLQHEIRFPTSLRPPTPPGQADDLAAFLSSLK